MTSRTLRRAEAWTTADECAFMHRLVREGKLQLAGTYCEMILRNERRWDPGIDLDRVMACTEECLAILRAMDSGVAA